MRVAPTAATLSTSGRSVRLACIMGRRAGPDAAPGRELAERYFESQLDRLELGIDQLNAQTLDELRESLARVNEAIDNSAGYETLAVKITARAEAVVVSAHGDAHFTYTILPFLLERKRVILMRIGALDEGSQKRGIAARQAWDQISRHPLWSAVIAALLVAGLGAIVATLSGGEGTGNGVASQSKPSQAHVQIWGPPRRVYACDSRGQCIGADHVVFNSTINHPTVGDERFFVSARKHGDAGPVGEVIDVESGDRVTVRIFVANDAQQSLAGAENSVARGATARLEIPTRASETLRLYGWISADNAVPASVFDSVMLRSERPIRARLVRGTARLSNRAHPRGVRLADKIAGAGTPIGYREMNGIFGSCYCESGYITLDIVVVRA